MSELLPLIDTFGRLHNNLRISVTDRCNIRCFYCMPAENVEFMEKSELLTFEEIERFVRVAAPLGINKFWTPKAFWFVMMVEYNALIVS
mgnify:CR=1 FL=1